MKRNAQTFEIAIFMAASANVKRSWSSNDSEAVSRPWGSEMQGLKGRPSYVIKSSCTSKGPPPLLGVML